MGDERRRGEVGAKARAVERAHQVRCGVWRPYWEIALDVFAETLGLARAAEVIRRALGVSIAPDTVRDWIERGEAECERRLCA